MKIPGIAWVLLPNYKPVVVLIVDQMETERLGQWYVTDSGQLHRADRVYMTQEEAMTAAIARLDSEQTAAHRAMIVINKRRAALNSIHP